MKAAFHIYLVLLAIQSLLACNSESPRCSQYFSSKMLAEKFKRDQMAKTETETNQAKTEEPVILASRITYKISAKGLMTKPGHYGKPDAFPVVYHGHSVFKNDICMTIGWTNPTWRDQLSITYVDGTDAFIKIEIYDEWIDSNWTGDTKYVETLGRALFYVKDMLVPGRFVESTLWYPRESNFNCGTAYLEVLKVEQTKITKAENETIHLLYIQNATNTEH